MMAQRWKWNRKRIKEFINKRRFMSNSNEILISLKLNFFPQRRKLSSEEQSWNRKKNFFFLPHHRCLRFISHDIPPQSIDSIVRTIFSCRKKSKKYSLEKKEAKARMIFFPHSTCCCFNRRFPLSAWEIAQFRIFFSCCCC